MLRPRIKRRALSRYGPLKAGRRYRVLGRGKIGGVKVLLVAVKASRHGKAAIPARIFESWL